MTMQAEGGAGLVEAESTAHGRALVDAFYRATAARLGISASDLSSRYGLEVAGERPAADEGRDALDVLSLQSLPLYIVESGDGQSPRKLSTRRPAAGGGAVRLQARVLDADFPRAEELAELTRLARNLAREGRLPREAEQALSRRYEAFVGEDRFERALGVHRESLAAWRESGRAMGMARPTLRRSGDRVVLEASLPPGEVVVSTPAQVQALLSVADAQRVAAQGFDAVARRSGQDLELTVVAPERCTVVPVVRDPTTLPAFRAWFGDSIATHSGRPIGEGGRPLVLYHGSPTPQNLESFSTNAEGALERGDAWGRGAYLTSDPSEASRYSFDTRDASHGAVFPVFAAGRILSLDGPLPREDAEALTAFAERVLLPSDKARFETGRVERVFDDVEEAKDFFEAQRKNWETFGDGMDRARPEADARDGKYVVAYTDFDAAVKIESGEDALLLFKAIGFDNLIAAGFDGLMMRREDGAVWVVMHNTDGTIKSAIGNSGEFSPYRSSILHQPAFHGTPRVGFEHFSEKHVGTAQGTRFYGWGLYFTSNRERADWYRMAGPMRQRTDAQGSPWLAGSYHEMLAESRLEGAGGYAKAIESSRRQLEAAEAAGGEDEIAQQRGIHDALIAMQAAGVSEQAGRVLEVDLPEDSDLLHWDKPLAEQPPAVFAALERIFVGKDFNPFSHRFVSPLREAGGWMKMSGGMFYAAMVETVGRDKRASELLDAEGVKGIKWRESEAEAGFVVFRGDNVRISPREQIGNNGEAGPARPNILFQSPVSDQPLTPHQARIQALREAGDVAGLRELLQATEARHEPLRRKRPSDRAALAEWEAQWESIIEDARQVRAVLYALTGDPYGKPKEPRPKPPADELLEAAYSHPSEVPPEVMDWLRRRNQILTSDASDAVRWCRIVDTLRDDRLAAGEVTIYRAVDGDEIRPGDWVTTERAYAEEHLRRWLGGRGQVLEDVVDGRDVLASPTGNAEEAIYAPRSLSGPYQPSGRSRAPRPEQKASAAPAEEPALFDFSLPADGNVIRDYRLGDSSIRLDCRSDGVHVASLRTLVRKRGAGSARAAMRRLIDQADAAGVALELGASPLDKRTNLSRLVGFYQSLGFECTGRSVNPLGHPEMRRPSPAERSRTLYQFGGEKAATAELGALAKARSMLAAGETAQAVLEATGWQQGTDGKWRFEIDDSLLICKGTGTFEEVVMAAYRRGVERTGDQVYTTTLADVVFHPRLYEAYPQLAELEVQMLPAQDRKGGVAGRVVLDENGLRHMQIAEDLPSERWRSVVAHEIQHCIQEIEGFAVGDMYDREGYRGTAGEVEARNTQARLRMTAAERRRSLASATHDTPSELQAVSFRNSSQARCLHEDDAAQPAPRGAIVLPEDWTRQAARIMLGAGSDASTLPHEAAHFFLEVYADLAAKIELRHESGEGISAGEREIQQDMHALLDWFGVARAPGRIQAWRAQPVEARRAEHERFAQGYEAYLAEGRAPSPGLRGMFERFAGWMKEIYTAMKPSDLTDDVRAVMGRMIAPPKSPSEGAEEGEMPGEMPPGDSLAA